MCLAKWFIFGRILKKAEIKNIGVMGQINKQF
jgi:hypothetical protein